MAMTLRLTDEETAQLRQQAEREGHSMHEVVRLAIQERIARQNHNERVRLAASAWPPTTTRSSSG
jgi:hypothetical protein